MLKMVIAASSVYFKLKCVQTVPYVGWSAMTDNRYAEPYQPMSAKLLKVLAIRGTAVAVSFELAAVVDAALGARSKCSMYSPMMFTSSATRRTATILAAVMSTSRNPHTYIVGRGRHIDLLFQHHVAVCFPYFQFFSSSTLCNLQINRGRIKMYLFL